MEPKPGISKTGVLIGVIVAAVIGVVLLIAVVFAAGLFLVGRRQAADSTRGSGLGQEFTYDLKAYRKTDPSLIAYTEAAPIATGFQAARGIAVDAADRIYVAGDQAVRIFDKHGARASEIPLDGQPRCLAVAADGTVYVGLKDHVEILSSDGKPQAAWDSLGPKATITSIAVGESGVFVADAGNRVVLRYDAAGKVVREIGRKDAARGIPGFLVPSPHFDLALAPDGLLRVVNPGHHCIEAYTVDGDLELSWGRASLAIDGFSGCCNPTDIAALPDGAVVTSEKGLPRVKIHDAQGQLVCVVAGAEAFPEDDKGLDLAVDSAGRILVLDPAAASVRVFVRKPETTSK